MYVRYKGENGCLLLVHMLPSFPKHITSPTVWCFLHTFQSASMVIPTLTPHLDEAFVSNDCFPSHVVAKKREEDDGKKETTSIPDNGDNLLLSSYFLVGSGDVGVGNPPHDIHCRSATTTY